MFCWIQRSFDPPNTSKRREVSSKRAVGDTAGGPEPLGGSARGWRSPCVCGARPWPTPIAELPCWGARVSATRRHFALLSALSLVFGAFLEAPKSYQCDSQTVAKLSSIRTHWFLFRWIQRSFDPPNTS